MKSNFVEPIGIANNQSTDGSRERINLVSALTSSKMYQDYERAFSETTGLPVSLRPVESWQLPHSGKRFENPFCSMMSSKSSACASCLRLQQELADGAHEGPHTMTCELGLSDTAVPIHLGDRLVGFLQTGQVFRKKPTEAQYERTTKLLESWGVKVDEKLLRKNYFSTKTLNSKQYDAVVKLLAIFAQHISMVSNQLLLQRESAEPPPIARARQYIQDKHAEDLSLGQVAKFVNMSSFYFCKMFKKSTGLNFTDYVSRVRVEKTKNLLLNQNLRVSEIAYEVGFQSLTHFNRVFKRIMGQSPTDYRHQLKPA